MANYSKKNIFFLWVYLSKPCPTLVFDSFLHLSQTHTIFFFPNFRLFIVLGYSRLTTLWLFQVNSKGSQPYVHINPFSLKPPSHPGWHVTLRRVPCAMLIQLAIHFEYSSADTRFWMQGEVTFLLCKTTTPLDSPVLSPCSYFLRNLSVLKFHQGIQQVTWMCF